MVYIDDTLAQRVRYISLYEVMRTERGDVDELDPSTGQSATGDLLVSPQQDELPVSGSPFNAWLARTRNPIVVRLPRGLAATIALAFLALIVLAYWVGYHRAVALADTHPQVDPVTESTVVAGGQAKARGRAMGLSYHLLIDLPASPDAWPVAQNLQYFLRRHGVESTIIPVDNTAVQVFALKGFTDEQLAAQEHLAHENELRKLGKRWKNSHGGATDFSAMRPEKYTGS